MESNVDTKNEKGGVLHFLIRNLDFYFEAAVSFPFLLLFCVVASFDFGHEFLLRDPRPPGPVRVGVSQRGWD